MFTIAAVDQLERLFSFPGDSFVRGSMVATEGFP